MSNVEEWLEVRGCFTPDGRQLIIVAHILYGEFRCRIFDLESRRLNWTFPVARTDDIACDGERLHLFDGQAIQSWDLGTGVAGSGERTANPAGTVAGAPQPLRLVRQAEAENVLKHAGLTGWVFKYDGPELSGQLQVFYRLPDETSVEALCYCHTFCYIEGGSTTMDSNPGDQLAETDCND